MRAALKAKRCGTAETPARHVAEAQTPLITEHRRTVSYTQLDNISQHALIHYKIIHHKLKLAFWHPDGPSGARKRLFRGLSGAMSIL